MSFEELVINLINAINNYNLEETKQYVELINELPGEECSNLTELLDIYRETNYALDNECFDYILLHLHYLRLQDNVRWRRDINKLLDKHNNADIEQFISNQLNQKTYIIENKQFIQGLIQLAVNLQDREKTSKVFEKLLPLIKEAD